MKPVLVDASFIVARLDRRQQHHVQCLSALEGLEGPLITCEAVIAESCHLLRGLHGAQEAILENVAASRFQIPMALASRASEIATLLKKYADVPMDLADGCLVDLATQVGSGRILTLDGDFKIYRWGRNRAFEMLIDL
jgi:predicted nucleic acid-binding protein